MAQTDMPKFKVKETVSVRKFKGDPTAEQIAAGEVEPYEVLTMEDGVIIDRWVRDDGTD